MFGNKKIIIISMCFFLTACGPFDFNFYGSSYRIGDQPREEVFIRKFVLDQNEREKEIKACQRIPERKRIYYICSLAIDADRFLKGQPRLYADRQITYESLHLKPPSKP
ncbi:hypothetical protein N5853_06280 [Bartonella sp. HY329]|uniref:hypothetical protein n=1 Tax=unclassified Bartonella TaxID=2645622 RepID=UPI0021CA0608|nr:MULTISPECIES: hypothetical protein [unclassified Bartonella]UXM96214.1 hypothetical protein N5853_06280 [Bartonella sp. HY329]UXN10538.1 hypothetical protein N5852_06290 [Bartonella sp. HY328]